MHDLGKDPLFSAKGILGEEHFLSQHISAYIEERFGELSRKMEALFAVGDEPAYWNSYLDSSGAGVSKYLEQIVFGNIPALLN